MENIENYEPAFVSGMSGGGRSLSELAVGFCFLVGRNDINWSYSNERKDKN